MTYWRREQRLNEDGTLGEWSEWEEAEPYSSEWARHIESRISMRADIFKADLEEYIRVGTEEWRTDQA